MKRFIFSILISISFLANAQQLKAYFNQSFFWSPTDGEYAEVYFTFVGSSTKFIINEKGKFNSELSILITYSQENEIKHFLKYSLKSPEVADSNSIIPNFIDIQRLKVNPGKYKFAITIIDINDTISTLKYFDDIEVPEIKGASFSSIELLESFKKADGNKMFNKNGYNIVPYVSDYYPSDISSFNFYTELYILDSVISENEGFLMKYYIEPFNNSKYKLGSYTKVERRKASQINVVMGSFNIEKLPSGNYNLVVECINRKNNIVASNKLFFQRNNRKADKALGNVDSIKVEGTFIDNETNIDTLTDYIKCLFPIMESKQITFALNQLKVNNTVWMQKFFYGFWKERSPYDAEGEWLKYKSKVYTVNKHFSTQIKRGYETDRGRIYLKYGPPNNIIKRRQPVDSYPYEMWHYNTTPKQGNVKVIFYNPNMISGDFVLLYTNLVEESSDPNWKTTLMKINSNSGNFGNTVEDDFRSL